MIKCATSFYNARPNDFCISSIFEFCIEWGSVVGFPFQRSGEGPLTIANLVPVFPGNPSVSLLFVSAFGPLPQAFVNLIVNPAEHLGGYHISLTVYPTANYRVEFANQRFLFCGFVFLDDVPHFLEEGFDGGLGWFNEQFRSVYKELHADRETGC